MNNRENAVRLFLDSDLPPSYSTLELIQNEELDPPEYFTVVTFPKDRENRVATKIFEDELRSNS